MGVAFGKRELLKVGNINKREVRAMVSSLLYKSNI